MAKHKLVEAGVADPEEVQAQLADVSSRLETLEAQKHVLQQRQLKLQAIEASRKPLLAEVETLKQRLRKTDGEITETRRQIGRDESLLTPILISKIGVQHNSYRPNDVRIIE